MIDRIKELAIGAVVFIIGFQVFFALIKPYLPLIGQTLAYAFVALVVLGVGWVIVQILNGRGGGGGGLMRGR